jgi:hypothetical protein
VSPNFFKKDDLVLLRILPLNLPTFLELIMAKSDRSTCDKCVAQSESAESTEQGMSFNRV